MNVKEIGTHPQYPDRSKNLDAPVNFTHQIVLNGPVWADPEDPNKVDWKSRFSHEGNIIMNCDFPLNPICKTGMTGRGLLGQWGPNHAADPMVTRTSPSNGKLEMIFIKRGDTGEIALPGGMVNPGEKIKSTLLREFEEETLNIKDYVKRNYIINKIAILFQNDGIEVYKGYVNDPRNTDNAWMETVAVHFHCDDELAQVIELKAGDDAIDVMWRSIEKDDLDTLNLYASHKDWVVTVSESFH